MLGLALILACSLLLDGQRAYPGAWALLPTLGAVLAVLAGSLPHGQRGAGSLLALPPLQWLGRISYSWYLWHWPVLLLGLAWAYDATPALRALLVGISLVLAAVSHALVEAPLRHWKQWLAWPRAAALASLAAMAGMALLATHWSRQASDALQSRHCNATQPRGWTRQPSTPWVAMTGTAARRCASAASAARRHRVPQC